jgi:hypothetical protein
MTLSRFDPPLKVLLVVAVVIALATYVRLTGTWWDGTAGLHPDERHMLFVSLDMMRGLDDPLFSGLSWSDWWFSQGSPANPRGQDGGYVYGELPYLAVTLLGWLTGLTGWDDVMILGRQVSAILDASVVLAVFVLACSLTTARGAVAAAVIYAAAPTALQLSNFYTVDIWLTAASAWTLCATLAMARSDRLSKLLTYALVCGVLTGLAVACKIVGLVLGLPIFAALIVVGRRLGWRAAMGAMTLGAFCVLVTFRLANPYAFGGPGVLGLTLSPAWLADMTSLFGMSKMLDFPPNWQWIAGYGPLRFLRDFMLFGTGPVLWIILGLGVAHAAFRLRAPHLILISFVVVFLIQGVTAAVPALRYSAPALPVLAALAAPALARFAWPMTLLVVSLALWWGAGAVRLHDGQHPRLLASVWLWDAPRGSVIVNETGWDEGLPTQVFLPGVKDKRWPGFEDHFTYLTLDIVAEDNIEKVERMVSMIDRGDYIAISSGRQRDVMPRLPERFPMTAEYYRLIASPESCLEVVWSADRGYPLPFLAFDDRWAQEPWRVYDHPIVTIYRKTACFDPATFAARLKAALPD